MEKREKNRKKPKSEPYFSRFGYSSTGQPRFVKFRSLTDFIKKTRKWRNAPSSNDNVRLR